MSAPDTSSGSAAQGCVSTEDGSSPRTTTSAATPTSPRCDCPRSDDQSVVTHRPACFMYRTYDDQQEDCTCKTMSCDEEPGACLCPPGQCACGARDHDAYIDWHHPPPVVGAAMPALLESTHPLMQRFQDTLRKFLDKENAIAQDQILNLRDELRLSRESYDRDLETIYRSDHDTNQQRAMIEEYEAIIAKTTADRRAAEERQREITARYKDAKSKLDQDIMNEREANEELQALTELCRQLDTWRADTEAELTISQRCSDKMRADRRVLAHEKRQLDMIIYGLSREVWRLESKLEMFLKQIQIKQAEMEKVNDKVTAFGAELEDLELEKRRLVCLWNSVLVNIKQRDNVFDSVRDDYRALQENYRTLLNNLEVTKKTLTEEMNRGRELAMSEDKLLYDIGNAEKAHDAEDARRILLETQIAELTESIEMSEKDEAMNKSENQLLANTLSSTEKECDRKIELKLKIENEILANLQECLLNDKAVESMANGIKSMRELSRKQEIALTSMENQHAKVMFDIEVARSKQASNQKTLEDIKAKSAAREREVLELEEQYETNATMITRKQREFDLINKKFLALKEVFDMKSPQDRQLEELEMQIRALRERTEALQGEWLRLQGHVVRLTAQHEKLSTDVNLVNKQIQICEQKTMHIQAGCDAVAADRGAVERALRDLRGRLEVLARARKQRSDRNHCAERANLAITHEYIANLKDAESDILQLEEDITNMEKEKTNLTQELDRVQREALVWQRKGIQAVELRRNMSEAKSAVGEIGQMRNEIHRMTVRREQLRRTSEKLSEDLAQCVTRRDNAMEKSRAAAAVEKALGASARTPQSQYRHRLRLAKADLARVSKDVNETKARMDFLKKEQERLQAEMVVAAKDNFELEERVARLLKECMDTERNKQWLLERVVRTQRLGTELTKAVRKQNIRVRKHKSNVLQEYKDAKDLNRALRRIVEAMASEYPYMADKLALVSNTLNITSPNASPQLSDVEECPPQSTAELTGTDDNVAERPLSP